MGARRYSVHEVYSGKKHILKANGESLCGLITLSYIEHENHVHEGDIEKSSCQACRRIVGLKHINKPKLEKMKKKLSDETIDFLERFISKAPNLIPIDLRRNGIILLEKYREVERAENHN
jgi:phosphatidylinositol kinase/protein kinase (PI-3  family)